MHVTGEELEKLIKTVEKEFSAELASLAKSEDGEFPAKAKKPEQKEEKPEEAHEEAPKEEKEAAPHDEEASDEAPKEEGRAPDEAHGEAPAEHQEGAPVTDPAQAGHDYDEEDLEHMHKMYMSMSPGEQRAHHDALRKCMEAGMGMGKSEKEIEEQAPAGPKGPVAEASKVDGSRLDKLKKGENPRRGSGGQSGKQEPNNTPGAKSDASYTKNKELYDSKKLEKDEDGIEEQAPANTPGAKSEASYTPNKELYDMGKSEDMWKSEAEASKAKVEALQKTLDGVSEFLTKLVSKTNVPKGKAVTSYDAIAKSEDVQSEQPMSKAEITATLAKKAADPTLSKADRDAINEFYWNGADLTRISHLLK